MEKLPQIHPSHIQEKKSIQRLEVALPKNLFILRAEDGGDYGVDRIIEVVKEGAVTNIRSHVQVKSSGTPQKKPGNFQFSVPISTLNYLLNSLNSIFLVYAEHEDQFYWDWVGTIAKERKAKKPASGTLERKTFSYNFSAKLDEQSILSIHERLISDTTFVKRLNLAKSPFEKVIITDFIHDRTYRDYLIMYAEEKYEKIIAIAKESLESSPIIYSLVALCYYNIYNYDEALKYILKAEQIEPDFAFKKIRVSILCEKGLKENNKRSLEQAKELFLSIESNEWGWMDSYNYGNVLSGLGELEKAEDCYRNAIRLEPNEATIWKNLSNVYNEQGKHDQELECLDTALTINPDLIEALICKGISLGQNFARLDEALVYLEKALSISKASMINNRSIYYWISEFRNSLRYYKASLDNVKEGLDYHPGDSYLENLKLRTLIVASEENIEYETEAIEMLEGIRSKYPSDLRIKVELLKLLKRRKTGKELFPLISESFATQNYRIEPEAVHDLKIEEIIFILEDLETLFIFRNTSNLGQLFFERYNISIAKFQLIEMKANFLFLKLNSKMHFIQGDAIISLFQQQVQEFLSFCEYCTEILASDLATDTVEAKAELITKIITTLPEILLIEFSRQNGWLLKIYGHPIEIADQFINNTDSINGWFDKCLLPILKGANNVFKWSKENSQDN